jgi:hypothetical protein
VIAEIVPMIPWWSTSWPMCHVFVSFVFSVIILNCVVVLSPTTGLVLRFRSCQSTLGGKLLTVRIPTYVFLTLWLLTRLSVYPLTVKKDYLIKSLICKSKLIHNQVSLGMYDPHLE